MTLSDITTTDDMLERLNSYVSIVRDWKTRENARWLKQLIAQAEYNLNSAKWSVYYLAEEVHKKEASQ